MTQILTALALLFAFQIPLEAAFRFGLARSVSKRAGDVMEEAIPAKPTMVLPISPLQAVTSGQVIWPFGVPGSSHPNGHPGIDFLVTPGASLFATADAKVQRIDDEYTDGAQQRLIMLETPGYQIFLIGSAVNLTVSAGDVVRKGQKIGELGQSAIFRIPVGFLHWGINPRSAGSGFTTDFCPYNALSSSHQIELERLFALSTYDNQAAYPLICNPCAPGGCR